MTQIAADSIRVHIQADRELVPMGLSTHVTAQMEIGPGREPQDFILLPFVNQRRWGAHERPDGTGRADFYLPLPNPGPAWVQVAAVRADDTQWMGMAEPDLLMVGHPMPSGEPLAVLSNLLPLEVTRRVMPAHPSDETLFCMQWEPWFIHGVRSWQTAQAVPLMGFYDSYNRDVIRQHMLWMIDLGVDFIMPDWTNHIWERRYWDERPDYTNAIIHATTLFLEVLAEMRNEGLPVPKAALFPGLSNGQPATMQALNEELAWIYHTYVRNPRFEGLFQEFEGKPLMMILDTGAVGDRRGTAESAFRIPFFKQTLALSEVELDAFRAAQPPVDESQFTIRWISSQNQTTRHHELGYWSWMDGVSDPPITYKDGKAEAVTVTPSFFNALGWTGPGAYGRRGGATYLQTFQTALQHRPQVIFLHQFNEYSGQREGHGMGADHSIYVDTFNVELSDDLEPVSPTAPGYRGDGGWGFYYLNLTRALMALYRDRHNGSTLLTVSSPVRMAVADADFLPVAWTTLGQPVECFTLLVDGQPVQQGIRGTSAQLPLQGLAQGLHMLTVVAEGAQTRYPLSWTDLDEPLTQPIPVRVDVPFSLT